MSKILVIDDEPGMRQVISKVLEPLADEIYKAEDGHQALELFRKVNPDLCMLDIRLPDMDGLEILAQIKQINPNVPVIMLSGFGDVETAVELVRRGAFDYISKPFKVDKLHELVRRAFAQSGLTSSDEAQGVPEPDQKAETTPVSKDKPVVTHIKIKNAYIFSALGFILLSAASFFAYKYFNKELPPAEFTIHYLNPSAICRDKKSVWVSDWVEETIFRHNVDASLSVAMAYKLPDMQPMGLASDGVNLWSCSSFEGKIYKHNLDYNLSVAGTFDAPGTSISGLYIEGDFIWSMDYQTGKIYKHKLDNALTVMNVYDSNVANPIGMFRKGRYYYVADAKSNLIYKLKASDFSFVNTYTIPNFEGTSYRLSGISFDGKSVWICAAGVQKIFRYPLSRLKPAK